MPKRRARGDGAIYFDEKRKKYIGQISLGVDAEGKRKRKTVYGNTKAEVKEKLKGIEFQIYSGTFSDDSEITIYHLAKQLLDDKLNQGEIKAPTFYRHSETLKRLAPIYNTPLQSVTETQIRDFLNSTLHYSQSTVGKNYDLLNRTLREAVRRKIISQNPMEYIKKPRSKKEMPKIRAFTKDEQKRFIEVLQSNDINYKNQMLLSVAIGLRMGEVNALHVEDVNFNFNCFTVRRTISKGAKGEAILGEATKTAAGTRTLTMTSAVRNLLLECIGDRKNGLIFTHKDKIVTTSQVNDQFKRTLKKFNILDDTVTDGKINLHSLRHTFGTRCAEAGMPPKVLQEIMGHTDISVTMNTYFYATKDYMNENIRRVDSLLEAEGLTIESGQKVNSEPLQKDA